MQSVSHTAVRFAALSLVLASGTALAQGPVPPVLGPAPAAPPTNQATESKRVLGKVLFWDEQVSSTGSVSCGTCHSPALGGGDNRRVRTPGFDNVLNNADDKFGSPGVVASDAFNEFRRSEDFGLAAQVTDRATPTMINAVYSNQFQFWDGRAGGQFRDPQTNAVVSANGAALESQAVGPVLSNVEMAHDSRTWDQVASKLARSRPMGLATDIPADVAAVLADGSTYPTLFARAFGDGAITGTRIGQAIATYERTLVSNQSPYDAFAAGNAAAITPNQRQGWAAFNSPQAQCNACHTAPTFAGVGPSPFHNLGLRPAAEDLGRQLVTGDPANRGQMKIPTLRNVALRNTFMHTGQFTTLNAVLAFYARAPGSPVPIQDNRSPILNTIAFPPQVAGQIQDFLTTLTDPRVAAQTFPFDRPTLWTQRAGVRPTNLGGGVAVPGGGIPTIIVVDATVVGGEPTRIGLADVPADSVSTLLLSKNAPINGIISPSEGTMGPVVPDADSVMTKLLQTPAGTTLDPIYVQWQVTTPGGTGRSAVVRITPICPTGGCPSTCPSDIAGSNQSNTPDGVLTADDVIVFISQFFAASPRADIAGPNQTAVPDGSHSADDIIVFLNRYFAGC